MFKITRINDNKIIETEDYKFIVFNEDNRGRELVDTPEVGASLIVPPYNGMFSWMTSPIVEVISEFHFKTKNSEYHVVEI